VPTGELEFSIVSDRSEFEQLEGDWDDVVLGSARPTPFHLHGWLAERWRHVEQSALLVVARRNGLLCGALPLAVRRHWGMDVGRWLAGTYSGLDLVLAGDEPATTGRAVVERAGALDLDYFEVNGLGPGSELARAAGDDLQLVRVDHAPKLDMPDGWRAAYVHRTSSKTRNTHGRRLRDLERLGALEFHVASTTDDLPEALEAAFMLHDRRWAARRGEDRSRFTSPALTAMHRAAVRRESVARFTRILVLRLEGRPIAFTFCFVLGGTLSLHRLGYDPAFSAHSPGLVALLAALEDGAGNGATRVDFLRGMEPYKLQLADSVEPLFWGVGLGRSAAARAATAARIANRRARLAARRVPLLHTPYRSAKRTIRQIRE
jgi:CelD/BcsL family acetyltransferase involved in cellulose biosynthesis